MPTKTIKSSGGDYTSIAGWEAGEDNNLSGTGENIGEVYDVNEASALTIAGSTNVSASDYRHLTVNSAFRHAGVFSTGKTHFSASTTDGVLIISENFFRVSYSQIRNTHATSGGSAIKVGATDNVVSQCIATASATTFDGIFVGGGSNNLKVINTVSHGFSSNGIVFNAADTGSELDNSAFVGNGAVGVKIANTQSLTLKNVYCGGNGGDDFNEAGTTGWFSGTTATTCMCQDSITETGLTSGVAWSTANFTNVTAGSIDIHLVSGSALINAGTDLSGTFTLDINGNTRSGTWDVGPDEFVTAASVTYPMLERFGHRGAFRGMLH